VTTPHRPPVRPAPLGDQEATRAKHGAVVVGIDGSASAVRAAVWAGAEARRRERPLRLVQVYTLPQVHTGLPTR
jgi:microcompartment protein CcmL/EutN